MFMFSRHFLIKYTIASDIHVSINLKYKFKQVFIDFFKYKNEKKLFL